MSTVRPKGTINKVRKMINIFEVFATMCASLDCAQVICHKLKVCYSNFEAFNILLMTTRAYLFDLINLYA